MAYANTALSSGVHIPALAAERHVIVPLSMVAVFFAVQQAGLGALDYLPEALTRVLQACMVTSVVLLALLGVANLSGLPVFHRRMVFALIALNSFYAAASVLFGGIRPLFHLESIVFALALVPIISDSRAWLALLRLLYWGTLTLIALNTITLAHWAGWINLQPEVIPRLVDTGADISHLDPFSFGIFGRTESFEVENQFFARLQGWALEPLHWGYFVALAIACGLILQAVSRGRLQKHIYAWSIALPVVHLIFVRSASVFVTLAAWVGAVLLFTLIRRLPWCRRKEALLLFVVVVLGTGFAIPFALALMPDVALLLYTEDVTGKGTNWETKIGFLSLGTDIFTRFIPLANPDLQTSHNLVLEMYLHYGYFIVFPVLAFFYWFLRHAVIEQPTSFIAAGLLVALCHMTLVPTVLFYPSGTLFLALLMVAAHFNRTAR
jgi:hypothetical protein